MIKFKTISQIFLFLLLICLIPTSAYALGSASEKKKVIILHGLWGEGRWNKQFNSSFYDEMVKKPDFNVGITYEYLGLEYVQVDARPQAVISHLRNKTEKISVDLVIGVLPRANKFLLSFGQELFPGVPKVLLIPGSSNMAGIKDSSDTFAIPSASTIALRDNVKEIFSILPDTQNLVVICGNGLNDQYFLSIAKAAIVSSNKTELTRYLVGIPREDLLERVSTLPEHSVILFLTYDEDIDKKKYLSVDFFPELSEKANAPVFSFFDTLMGKGIVGGTLSSANSYAKTSAEIGIKILRGEQPPVISEAGSGADNIYDWRQLKRWDISEDRLPPGSQIRYKTESFLEAYKIEIIFVTGIIVLQMLLIFALVTTLRRRRLTEKKLMASESTARALLETPTETIMLLDTEGIVLDANDVAVRLFSSSREKFVGSCIWDFMPRELAVKRIKNVKQVIQSGKLLRFEDRRVGKWLDNLINPIPDEHGNVSRIAVIAHDITQRKLAEAELLKHQDHLEELVEERTEALKTSEERYRTIADQQKKLSGRLEIANRELQDFAYIVSHDLKAPLRGISSLATWLHEDYADRLDDEGSEYIDKMITRTKRLSRLIDGILQYSRVGRVETELQSLESESVAREIIDMLSPLNNIQIGIDGKLPLIVYDKTLLVQILQNLLSNAIKHLGKPEGVINISNRELSDVWEFCVSDNGVGIEEKHFERVFKIFQTLNVDSEAKSTGIGLSLVKKIVERNGGTVRVESTFGEGSAFYFTIPK